MKSETDLIFGTGIDIVQVERMSRVVTRWGDKLLKRVWTDREINYCRSKQNPFEHFAARFAGKEAVSKSLGLTWSEGVRWKEIEIVDKRPGKPEVELSGETRRTANELKIGNIILSMSHCREYAVASAIITRESNSAESDL